MNTKPKLFREATEGIGGLFEESFELGMDMAADYLERKRSQVVGESVQPEDKNISAIYDAFANWYNDDGSYDNFLQSEALKSIKEYAVTLSQPQPEEHPEHQFQIIALRALGINYPENGYTFEQCINTALTMANPQPEDKGSFNYGYNEKKQDDLYKENQELKMQLTAWKENSDDWQKDMTENKKSAEQILTRYGLHEYVGLQTKPPIILAMEEYQSQSVEEEAIAFVEWINDNQYSEGHYSQKGLWFAPDGEQVAETTKELYQLFKKDNPK